jgi:hypothetical protein
MAGVFDERDEVSRRQIEQAFSLDRFPREDRILRTLK